MYVIKQLNNYLIDIKKFKKFFIENCGIKNKYECNKYWSWWLFTNYTNSESHILHLIPNPMCIDIDYRYLSDKNVDEKNYNKALTELNKNGR